MKLTRDINYDITNLEICRVSQRMFCFYIVTWALYTVKVYQVYSLDFFSSSSVPFSVSFHNHASMYWCEIVSKKSVIRANMNQICGVSEYGIQDLHSRWWYGNWANTWYLISRWYIIWIILTCAYFSWRSSAQVRWL